MGVFMNKASKIRKMIESRITLLGAGPMSKLSVDAIIDLASFYDLPIAMIPSRRQIECELLGGGYVENWTTEEFADYVHFHDKGKNIVLARDHCGPWQLEKLNYDGSTRSLNEEMVDVNSSLLADITSGFDVIHIDPSLGYKNNLNDDQVQDLVFVMIEYCESIKLKEILYEIGTEEQVFSATQVEFATEKLEKILVELQKRNLPKPKFYVQQTGTKVNEIRNVGSFDNQLDSKGILPSSFQLPKILEICNKNGVWLKEHNADYLSDLALQWHTRYGIHAANIAPEFGVAETRALINLAKKINALDLIEIMTEKVNLLGKWKKWMLDESTANEYEKMLIAGHYHFSEPWHKEWRAELEFRLLKKNINLHDEIYTEVRNSINRILVNFGYLNA
jgi:hypothetical protein